MASLMERYRKLYEHEKDANDKMLTMLDSVREANRSDPRFQQAVNIAAHLAAVRENYLDFFNGEERQRVPWFEERADFASLRPRFRTLEMQWTDYLAGLGETAVESDFHFLGNDGNRYGYKIEEQVLQLIGHAAYHRGQVVLLVDQLGGKTVDTDYIDWVLQGP